MRCPLLLLPALWFVAVPDSPWTAARDTAAGGVSPAAPGAPAGSALAGPSGPFRAPLNPEVIRGYRKTLGRVPLHISEARLPDRPAPTANAALRRCLTSGQPLRALALLVRFTDPPPGGPVARFAPTTFDDLVFGDTYLRAWPDTTTTRTLRRYLEEISYGAVDLVTLDLPSAVGWLAAPNPYAYYCENDETHTNGFGPYPRNVQRLVMDAVLAADPVVDFSNYAVNGVVENLIVVHAGSDAAWSGGGTLIWSHQWSIRLPDGWGTTPPPLVVDGVQVDTYAMVPEAGGDTVGEFYDPMAPLLPTVGTYAHEFGHLLGLPDEYDQGYESAGTGDISLMADGQWNCVPFVFPDCFGNSPAHPSAWARIRLGFAAPIPVVTSVQGVILPPVQTAGAIYKLVEPGSEGREYWLVENRQQLGFDQGLIRMTSDAHGLCVYHVDENVLLRAFSMPNEAECMEDSLYKGPNNCDCAALPPNPANGEKWYGIAWEQADGLFELERGTDWGGWGDFYSSVSGARTFDFASAPNAGSYYDTYACRGLVSVLNITEAGLNVELDLHPGVGFKQVPTSLLPVAQSAVAWGDVDGDGDLDVASTGDRDYPRHVFYANVYRNDGGGSFVALNPAGLVPCWDGSAGWGDYDGDGDVDLLLTGGTSPSLYRNDGPGALARLQIGLTGGYWDAAWGDYDNDGDLDILYTGGEASAGIYRNDGADTFQRIDVALPKLFYGAVAWGDYDNDGDLDALLAGQGPPKFCGVFRNDGGGLFTDVAAGMPGLTFASVAWGDYDNDGDLDALLGGASDAGNICQVWRNDAGSFADAAAGLPGFYYGAVAWGDYDNDGDLDILTGGGQPRVHRNDGAGGFRDIWAPLPYELKCDAAWGDYDGDGDLDILLGRTGIWRSDGAPYNPPPSAPTGLMAAIAGTAITLSWDAAADAQTPSPGLSYNVRIGTTPSGSEVLAGMADPAGGFRRIVALGNGQQRTWWSGPLPAGALHWSVQSLDGAFAGSPFAAERSLGAAATPPGTGITVSLGSAVELTFAAVQTAGQSLVEHQQDGPAVPEGLRLVPAAPPLYYGITTTASYTGPVTICVEYDPLQVGGNEAALELMHYDEERVPPAWVEITVSRDPADDVLCGAAAHLSTFAVMEPASATAADEHGAGARGRLVCSPNPVSGPAILTFELPSATAVRLGLFDLRGRLVRELARTSRLPAGRHELRWDGTGRRGAALAPGVYFLRLEAGATRVAAKILVLGR